MHFITDTFIRIHSTVVNFNNFQKIKSEIYYLFLFSQKKFANYLHFVTISGFPALKEKWSHLISKPKNVLCT